MIILGIDPGLATTGYGIIKFKIPQSRTSSLRGRQNSKFKILKYGCIKTSTKSSFAERLEAIYNELRKLIKKYKPDKIALERIFFAKNVKTAMQVGEARGVVTLVAIQNKVLITEFTPLQVKQCLTGYGRASKEQVQKMVKMFLSFKEMPKPDDAADALAVAITCWQTKSF